LFTLFHPVSNRNLKATFLAPFFEQDNKINGCLLGATIAIGKLVKSLLQLIKFCI